MTKTEHVKVMLTHVSTGAKAFGGLRTRYPDWDASRITYFVLLSGFDKIGIWTLAFMYQRHFQA